ncbi:MAG TPA: RidA family protein [Gaiellaceae bacterium]|nr:RidA family protein [Gaiellaceae bacterium]
MEAQTAKRRIQPAEGPKPAGHYSPGILAEGPLVFIAGQVGRSPGSQDATPGIGEQTKQALRNIETIIQEAGSSLHDLVKVSVFLSDISDFAEMDSAYRSVVPDPPPARTTVQCVLPPGFSVEIDAIARVRAVEAIGVAREGGESNAGARAPHARSYWARFKKHVQVTLQGLRDVDEETDIASFGGAWGVAPRPRSRDRVPPGPRHRAILGRHFATLRQASIGRQSSD